MGKKGERWKEKAQSICRVTRAKLFKFPSNNAIYISDFIRTIKIAERL